jgi:leucyl aminopeptidase
LFCFHFFVINLKIII